MVAHKYTCGGPEGQRADVRADVARADVARVDVQPMVAQKGNEPMRGTVHGPVHGPMHGTMVAERGHGANSVSRAEIWWPISTPDCAFRLPNSELRVTDSELRVTDSELRLPNSCENSAFRNLDC